MPIFAFAATLRWSLKENKQDSKGVTKERDALLKK
jgi:hypothetical protein